MSELKYSPDFIAKLIDHTKLNPDATFDDIHKLCDEAKNYGFCSVCVNPFYVNYAKDLLKGTDIKVAVVVGFPLGATTTSVKVLETEEAVNNGADEIDMVLNIGALKSKKYDLVYEDIKEVVEKAGDKTVKVIIETCLLTEDEKIIACSIAKAAGAGFVKTSTGFSTGGATEEDVKLMRKIVGDNVGVKASGGVRTYEDAIKMIEAGANRIGASKGVEIIEEARKRNS
jgi:deoxyribose-phosphate aldolase